MQNKNILSLRKIFLNKMTAREEILTRITQAKAGRKGFDLQEPDWQSNIYKEIAEPIEECFKQELEKVNGYCVLAENEAQIFSELKAKIADENIENLFCRDKNIASLLEKYEIAFSSDEKDFFAMQAGITACEFLIARTGSVMNSSALESGRQMHAYAPIHIVIAKKSQIVPFLPDALGAIQEKYKGNLPSAITNITGPSRTADIEKTLILGAHGPKEIWVFIDKNA